MSVNAFVADRAPADFHFRRVLRGGDARSVIGHEVLAWGTDLVALGTHARTGLGRMLLGSVAEAVTRDATCDILMARPSDSSTPTA